MGFIDKSKSVTFQVVHRSQRDPRIAESDRVLKPVAPSYNLLKKGKVLPDIDFFNFNEEEAVEFSQSEDEEAAENIEEIEVQEDASAYGVYFKDNKSYNYLKHMKPIGEDPTAVFVESKSIPKDAKIGGIQFTDLEDFVAMNEEPKKKVTFNIPSEVLPSKQEEDLAGLYSADVDIYDVDPSMREIFTALDDDAYVENEEDVDDFFHALNSSEIPEGLDIQLDEDAYSDDCEEYRHDSSSWYEDYQKFKQSNDSDDDYENIRETKTNLTALSMTSSAMTRTTHLTRIDDQFDQTVRGYDDEDSESEFSEPVLPLPSRIDELFDSFLETTEVVGRKRMVLNRVPEAVKVDAIRQSLGSVTKLTETMRTDVNDLIEGGDKLDQQIEREYFPDSGDEDKWDVESVLSTYSNIYNHPKLIGDIYKSTPKIRITKRGAAVVVDKSKKTLEETIEECSEEEAKSTIIRSKKETPEEKKARKQAFKDLKRDRRFEKKATKDAFKKESGIQVKSVANKKAQDSYIQL